MSRGEAHHELSSAFVDPMCDGQIRVKPAHPVDEPRSRLLSVGHGETPRHHLPATLAHQPVGGGDQRNRVDNEKIGRPGNDRISRALARVAADMGETFRRRAALVLLLLGASLRDTRINTGATGIAGRNCRIDGQVTQPASPTVRFPDIFETAHMATLAVWVVRPLDEYGIDDPRGRSGRTLWCRGTVTRAGEQRGSGFSRQQQAHRC